ncbi:hypothetical protein FH966_08360 [Lentibacillus cibarius]|uniref:DUF5392 family protein n=1 Tax=Lentibacillus cibarius TaxID=2583219 RepID=A0A549YII4_9BACI|nr:YwnF family protein [Lentibacillus cibarius]TMN22906.1 hypothetical protein FFL34_13020 [Lentibacillus cibarius]TRM11695.1 hypothetical protein FH966_08360 [Lentibacillus cibarius]
MNNNMAKGMPTFIERELETINELVKPKLKKSSKYTFIAIPLLSVSIINLFFMLVVNGYTQDMLITIGIYAFVGAVGAALYKESRHVNKEIRQIGMDHIIERIKTSEHVNDYTKDKYIESVKAKPKFSMQTFFNFLSEEQQRKKMMED